MRIRFECPHCRHRLAVDASAAGRSAKCPSCSQPVTVPAADAENTGMDATAVSRANSPGQAASSPFGAGVLPSGSPSSSGVVGTIYCPQCGAANDENRALCASCGSALHGPVAPRYVPAADGGLSTLIPYKNSCALWSYYLGVFSLAPCLGLPLGIAAVITGILGLKNANRRPEIRGKVHAWVGVVLGGLMTIVWTLAIVWSMYSMANPR